MIRILLHILILPAMLFVERKSAVRLAPRRAAALWYLLGVPLLLIESLNSKLSWKWLFFQGLVSAIFFLPAAYVAFRLAYGRERIWLPFFLYLALSIVLGVLAGLVLAQTPFAFGKL